MNFPSLVLDAEVAQSSSQVLVKHFQANWGFLLKAEADHWISASLQSSILTHKAIAALTALLAFESKREDLPFGDDVAISLVQTIDHLRDAIKTDVVFIDDEYQDLN